MARGGAQKWTALAGMIVALALPGTAAAVAPPTPWNGASPFNCEIQNAGLGTAVPHPNADPYCVSFDKTHQNVTQLGIVDFLSKEPARGAAAVPKCFYFQEDHWRGSIVQADASTVVYEFVGHYFFNKATGDGGAWVTDFTVAGHSFDPTTVPGFPPSYGQYFSQGTGGVITHDSIPADPSCAAKLKAQPGIVSGPVASHCVARTGTIAGRSLGPLAVGEREDRARASAGPPGAVKRGFLHYCVTGGGELLAGELSDRSGTFGPSSTDPIAILATTAAGFSWRRSLHVGTSASTAARLLHARNPVGRIGGLRVFRRGNLFAAVNRRRAVMVGLYDPRTVRRTNLLLALVRRAR